MNSENVRLGRKNNFISSWISQYGWFCVRFLICYLTKWLEMVLTLALKADWPRKQW